jgi:hypothetical protein
MTIGGISIILILGILNLGLLVFQLLSGLHRIKVRLGVHKITGVILFCSALIHGVLGFLVNL